MRPALVTTLFLLPLVCAAEDWPQFLGPQRTGISSQTGLINKFSDDGPELLWSTELGVGMSGLSVSDDTVVTLFQDAETQFVIALDAETGKSKWKTKIGDAFKNSMGNGPRATPTIMNATVYAYSGQGILTAISLKAGMVKWTVDTVTETSGAVADYGMSCSPLVTEFGIVVHVGSPNGCVCCYDLDGKLKWRLGDGFAGYSSPILTTLAGQPQVISLVGSEAFGIAPDTGKELWRYRYETDYNCNTACPVAIDGNSVLISAGENHGSTLLTVSNDGDSMAVTEGWKSLGKDSSLRAEWQTPILHGETLYGFDNIGSAGPITNLVAVDASTGKQLWMEKRFGKANATWADGKLFITNMKGELIIGTADENGFTETARAIVTGMNRQAPTIANGKLYLRDDQKVYCVNVTSP